jgi:hypothetical protein
VSRYEPITRMNTNEDQSPRNQMSDTIIFIEVHLLTDKLVLVVAIHPLRGSCANWHHTPNPQWVPLNQHKMGITQATSNPLEYLLAYRWRKVKNPLTITTIGARDNHLPSLDDPCCSKLSRWWQPPRVTSESRMKYEHQVPLDANTQAMHLDSLPISQR